MLMHAYLDCVNAGGVFARLGRPLTVLRSGTHRHHHRAGDDLGVDSIQSAKTLVQAEGRR
jgi:hypothetical protein